MKEKTHVYELLKKNLSHIHWQRIENVAGTGVPDANGCHNGIEFWSESKIAKSGAFHIRPDQIAWHTRRYNCGGRTFITVRENDSITIYRPDGRGAFVPLLTTAKPFAYEEIEKIFLYAELKNVI
jgi:hypothetical protein